MFRPTVAITIGDVAGIGPEVTVRACADERLRDWCRPVVVGHPRVLQRAAELVGRPMEIVPVESPESAAEVSEGALACWNPTADAVNDVEPGRIDPRAGEAAYEYLLAATHAALEGRVDALTTAPLNKAALHLAGRKYPGHTEILAEVCGVRQFAMMLHLPTGSKKIPGISTNPWDLSQPPITSGETAAPPTQPHLAGGLAVAHVTLHTSLASVPGLLTTSKVQETTVLIDGFLRDLGGERPRIAVCALNPHAGEGGLFGDEEATIIAPAVEAARKGGIDVVGPLPADTLLARAVAGEFDGVVAMYHDQGHIALKLIGLGRAVNVTLGLPIVRTSPSHGTAFDIAWQGRANPEGMLEAVRIAALLARRGRRDIVHAVDSTNRAN